MNPNRVPNLTISTGDWHSTTWIIEGQTTSNHSIVSIFKFPQSYQQCLYWYLHKYRDNILSAVSVVLCSVFADWRKQNVSLLIFSFSLRGEIVGTIVWSWCIFFLFSIQLTTYFCIGIISYSWKSLLGRLRSYSSFKSIHHFLVGRVWDRLWGISWYLLLFYLDIILVQLLMIFMFDTFLNFRWWICF